MSDFKLPIVLCLKSDITTYIHEENPNYVAANGYYYCKSTDLSNFTTTKKRFIKLKSKFISDLIRNKKIEISNIKTKSKKYDKYVELVSQLNKIDLKNYRDYLSDIPELYPAGIFGWIYKPLQHFFWTYSILYPLYVFNKFIASIYCSLNNYISDQIERLHDVLSNYISPSYFFFIWYFYGDYREYKSLLISGKFPIIVDMTEINIDELCQELKLNKTN